MSIFQHLPSRRTVVALMTAALGIGATPSSFAAWPTKEIRIMVPASPGGSTDLVARTVKAHLEKQLGAPVVIVNQTAGGGGVATNAVATAKPDGGTFLLFHALLHTAHLFGRSPLSFRDFTPIATISEVNNVLAVKKSAPYSTLAELLSYAKANPGKLKLASQLGGTTQVIGQATAKWLQNTVRVVDAGTEADRLASLLGEQTEIALLTTVTALQYDKAGEIKVLAVFNRNPEVAAPKWLTATAQGMPVSFPLTFTLYAPKGLPDELKAQLDRAMAAVAADESFKAEMTRSGTSLAPRNSQQAATFLNEEFNFVSEIIKSGSN